GLLKKTIFGHVCGGESIYECASAISELNRYGIGSILDYSVEGEHDEEGFDRTRDEILRTIQYSTSGEKLPFTVFKVTGLGHHHILTKIQSRKPLSANEKNYFEKTRQRVDQLCAAAQKAGIRI